MLNSYGYNRKWPEQDKAILDAVQRHHDIVASHGYIVVMTALVGSQNYDLDHENSDIDTYSLVYPKWEDIATGEDMKAGLIFADDGHCNFKDIRAAFRLLEKTSPNSVEYFVSKYKVYNPIFEPILKEYLDDNSKAWRMIHCNYHHMLYAIAGMAHQLTKRNMPAGKRFAHALRLDDMQYHFLNSHNASAVLEMRMGGNRDLALMAKIDTDSTHEEDYNRECEEIAGKLDLLKDNFHRSNEQEILEREGLKLIETFRWRLFQKYMNMEIARKNGN